MRVRRKSPALIDLEALFGLPPLPDLSLAMERGPRHFDGNAQGRVRGWHWLFFDRLEPEDFEVMAASDALDWVIIPLQGQL